MRLGILGGGQLGRMLALAGHPLGVTTTVYDPAESPCAAQVCSHVRGEFEGDFAALYEFARRCDTVTYEFENVPVATARWLAERVPVYPPPRALEVSQDRVTEKEFLRGQGVPTPEFRAVDTEAEFRAALAEVGLPAVLKTRRFGYDGKGQAVLRTPSDAEAAWGRLGGRPLILEELVEFDRELSVLAVRGTTGETAFYPLAENAHQGGILHRSRSPAPEQGEELFERACDFAGRLLAELDYAGVLTVEWFQQGSRLIANEIAPRVHNSGHGTLDASVTSQFENHLRAILGLPLGSTAALAPSLMYNFVGTLPPVAEVLRHPRARFHAYGKADRPGRKVGHVTLSAPDEATLAEGLAGWDVDFARG